MKANKFSTSIITLAMSLGLSVYTVNAETVPGPPESKPERQNFEKMKLNHSTSKEVPEDLKVAENPTYPVNSKAVILTDHMEGMYGAVAKIEGAYTTTVYSVTYYPTTGGEPVEGHKWVIHEEIENAGEEPYKPGDVVVLDADHHEGMDGATAIIDSAVETTVYMVSYNDTETNKRVKNHKWVVESELAPYK
ncbi:hypothetical protein DRW41_00795 [Neobacillus piezotolerans]|uniref:DUF1541 domain-containing protein n=1 Tax=Neobacillus piezotolerans TaxID=2259171 RepID=A0A3D8GUJ2_9BACI|nr:YdhK family protein [Neobacillus piezotolerans]RDU38140.1 hypothetical protein DRW41_00795 [Neobacillus piezotolerans]